MNSSGAGSTVEEVLLEPALIAALLFPKVPLTGEEFRSLRQHEGEWAPGSARDVPDGQSGSVDQSVDLLATGPGQGPFEDPLILTLQEF